MRRQIQAKARSLSHDHRSGKPSAGRHNKTKLAQFRRILLEMRDDAVHTLQEHQNALKSGESDTLTAQLHDQSVGFMERSLDALAREEANQMAKRQLDLIHSIDRAMERIEQGTYGLCVTCKGRIPEERLRIVPHTRQCAKCKNAVVR